MRFVKFPDYEEVGKEIFAAVRQEFPCKEKLYIFPLTRTQGVVYCGEPTTADLLPAVLIKRLLSRKSPFVFFFPAEEDKVGAAIYDGSELHTFYVKKQLIPVQSVFSFIKNRLAGTEYKAYALGDDTFIDFLKTAAASKIGAVEIKKPKPKPVSSDEVAQLLSEPTPLEPVLKALRKLRETAKDPQAAARFLLPAFTVAALFAGWKSYPYLKKLFKERHKAKVVVKKKPKGPPPPTPANYNGGALKLLENLLVECREGTFTYDGRKVVVRGCSPERPKGMALYWYEGKPVEVAFSVVPDRSFKGEPYNRWWKEVSGKLPVTGTAESFFVEGNCTQTLRYILAVNTPVSVRIAKEGEKCLITVKSRKSPLMQLTSKKAKRR